MSTQIIHQASFFNVRFEDGVFVFELDPNVRVDKRMCQEFIDAMALIYDSIGRAFPLMVKVTGILSMNREARDLAKENQNTGFVYASSILTSNVIWFQMMKLIVSIIGSKKLPRAFFTKHDEAEEWLENQRLMIGIERIAVEETIHAFTLNT